MWLVDHKFRWHGPGPFGWLDDFLWVLLLLALLVLVVILILRLVRSNGRPFSSASSTDRALEILRERYAKGEISHDEYETMKKNLGG